MFTSISLGRRAGFTDLADTVLAGNWLLYEPESQALGDGFECFLCVKIYARPPSSVNYIPIAVHGASSGERVAW
jgi:hypothetical protein